MSRETYIWDPFVGDVVAGSTAYQSLCSVLRERPSVSLPDLDISHMMSKVSLFISGEQKIDKD